MTGGLMTKVNENEAKKSALTEFGK